MPEPDLHDLIRDTLVFLKDPLLPKQTLFTSAEELAFFRLKASTPTPPPKETTNTAPRPPQPPKYIPPVPMQPPKKEVPPPKEPIPIKDPKPSVKVQESVKIDGSEQIKRTLLRMVPHIKLIDEIPDDTNAKKIGSSWKEKIPDVEVVLLACETNSDTLELLKSLGKAIDQNLAKAKIIPAEKLEQENRWDIFLQKNQFRLIIASDGMKKLTGLMKFYHSIPAQSQVFLDKTPLLELSPSSIYKLIEHKAHLWKTLCQMLKK